jgi:CheY-like chemotaxis protein
MKSRAIETLERQLEERTLQLELANRARSRFLAASHDLRQPLHALGLFFAQLRDLAGEVEQKQIIKQIDATVSALNERFNELLDLSKVDIGAVSPSGRNKFADSPTPVCASLDRANGKLIVVIDDDPLVLDGTCGLLRSWGCSVVTGDSGSGALAALVDQRRPPDLIISDFRLSDGKTGIEAIAGLRSAFPGSIPAFLVSGDISPEPLNEARASGFHLLHKPVDAMTLRAVLIRMLKKNELTSTC